ncbi:MAG: restriction endonuclease subunit S [Fimbriimonadaceae bacterium]|nr:restriction endonuclease subunit S [Fimbriimonadaceae bacterium]MBX3649392.1 restriction endonuclease subunit S [Rhodocyclaceae bacterium]
MSSSACRTAKVPLGDVAFFQEGPGLRTHQWTTEGMKVINVTNIIGDGSVNVTNTDKFVSLEEFETRYAHFAIEENDIVVASSGNTYGKVGRIRVEHLPLMMNTSVIRFHSQDRSSLDNDFLYVWLRSPEFINQVEGFVTGGAQPNFGPTHLKRMRITLPGIQHQKAIADILSAYDDLIENNKRRDGVAGGSGAAALSRMVRPPPLSRPRTHPHHQRRAGGVGQDHRVCGYGGPQWGDAKDNRCRLLGGRDSVLYTKGRFGCALRAADRAFHHRTWPEELQQSPLRA